MSKISLSKNVAIDIKGILSSKVVAKSAPVISTGVGSLGSVYSLVMSEYDDKEKELDTEIKALVNDLISKKDMDTISNFLLAKSNKENLEKEIKALTRKLNREVKLEPLEELFELRIELEDKKLQLVEVNKTIAPLYKKALRIKIPANISSLHDQVSNIRDANFELIDEELRLLEAKKHALELMRDRNADTLDLLEEALNEKLGVAGRYRKVVYGSRHGESLMKVILR